MPTRRSTLLAVLSFGLAACSIDQPRGHVLVDPQYDRYAPALEVSMDAMTRRPSGLYVRDISIGDGAEAVNGMNVDVHYTGWLPNGTKFDSSHDRNEPITFRLGGGQVIRGWDEGLLGMRVGGKRRLIIPAQLAYAAAGAGDVIPPNANLVFDVQLVGAR